MVNVHAQLCEALKSSVFVYFEHRFLAVFRVSTNHFITFRNNKWSHSLFGPMCVDAYMLNRGQCNKTFTLVIYKLSPKELGNGPFRGHSLLAKSVRVLLNWPLVTGKLTCSFSFLWSNSFTWKFTRILISDSASQVELIPQLPILFTLTTTRFVISETIL